MKRLPIVLILSLVIVASGCTSQNPAESNDNKTLQEQSPKDSAASSTNQEANDGKPDVHLTSFNVDSDDALIQENITLSFTVVNNGTAPGEFEEELEASLKLTGWTDYSELKSFEKDIPAGETKEFSFENQIVDDDDIRYKLGDRTEKVDVKARNLSIGESFTNLAGVRMTVEDLELKNSYMTDDGEHTGSSNFLFLKFKATNTGKNSTDHIGAPQLTVYTDQDDDTGSYDNYGDAEYASNYEDFADADLKPDETRTGYLAFEVPYGINAEEFVVLYHGEVGYGLDQRVYWNRE